MNDIKKQNARRATAIAAALTLLVAGAEIFLAFMNYEPGMNFLDITSYVTANKYIYFLILIAGNMALLPCVVLLYKENGISLKNDIFGGKMNVRDILISLAALALAEIAGLLVLLTYKGRTDMAYTAETHYPADVLILWVIALGLVSGIVKEMIFRGMAKRFAAPVMGETTAFLLFNTMFAVLDWHNYGCSFVLGLVLIWAYKKSGHLIAPMIAHGLCNVLYLVYIAFVR